MFLGGMQGTAGAGHPTAWRVSRGDPEVSTPGTAGLMSIMDSGEPQGALGRVLGSCPDTLGVLVLLHHCDAEGPGLLLLSHCRAPKQGARGGVREGARRGSAGLRVGGGALGGVLWPRAGSGCVIWSATPGDVGCMLWGAVPGDAGGWCHLPCGHRTKAGRRNQSGNRWPGNPEMGPGSQFDLKVAEV